MKIHESLGLMGKDSRRAEKSDESRLSELLEELIKIEDLSVVNGLMHAGGDKELYFKYLLQFCHDADEAVSSLIKDTKNSQWDSYAETLNSLKSVFETIGNQFMADWAARLESAAIVRNRGECFRQTHVFCETMKEFQEDLLGTDLPNITSLEDIKETITPALLLEKLELLRAACLDCLPETAEPAADKLLAVTINSTVDETLERLQVMVHAYDYDRAVDIIDLLMGLLDEGLV